MIVSPETLCPPTLRERDYLNKRKPRTVLIPTSEAQVSMIFKEHSYAKKQKTRTNRITSPRTIPSSFDNNHEFSLMPFNNLQRRDRLNSERRRHNHSGTPSDNTRTDRYEDYYLNEISSSNQTGWWEGPSNPTPQPSTFDTSFIDILGSDYSFLDELFNTPMVSDTLHPASTDTWEREQETNPTFVTDSTISPYSSPTTTTKQ